MSCDPKDVDLMRDVYMSFNQRAAFNRILERALSPPATYQSATDSDGIGSKPIGAGEGFVCVGWEFNDPRDGMGWQRLHWLSPESVPPSEPPVEMRRVYVAAPTPPAAAQEDGREKGRYFCDGPNGHFYLDNFRMASSALKFIDPDGDDWTITDLHDAAMLTSPDSGKEVKE